MLRLAQSAVASVVIGSMSVILAISFAALVYTGPLSIHLGSGIMLTLLGSILMALVGSLFCSYRGYVCGPQDITAILISGAGVAIATHLGPSAENTLPTVVAFLVVTSFVTGVVLFAAGVFKIGSMVRFMPYPVVAGFLAATGYLLLMGAFSVLFRESVTFYNIAELVMAAPLHLWLPWIGGGLIVLLLTRRYSGDLVIPLSICLSVVLFYLVVFLLEIPVGDARMSGLMLGPFDEVSLASEFSFAQLDHVDWSRIFEQSPTILAIAGLAILGSMLHTTGFSATFALGSDVERDLRGHGLANIAASSAGGLPGFMILGETILARRMGLAGILPAVAAAAGFGLVLSFGTSILSYLPAGLFALIISYLGFDLIWTWLWKSRSRLSALEHLTVGLIVLVAAAFSFLTALGIGILAAVTIFIYSYSNTEIVRMRSTVASRRSRVERSDEASALLSETGDKAVILELSGFVFFGTADRLVDHAMAELADPGDAEYLVLDFARVSGIDASAVASLQTIADKSAQYRATLVLARLSENLRNPLRSLLATHDAIVVAESLDSAIRDIEDKLLLEKQFSDPNKGKSLKEVVAELKSDFQAEDRIIRDIKLSAGEVLLESGARSTELYVLEEGRLRAEIENSGGNRVRVAEFRPYALIGEIAFYAGSPRTAWVVAEHDSRLVRIDLDRIRESKKHSVVEFHRVAARSLARRVLRMTQLNRDAEL